MARRKKTEEAIKEEVRKTSNKGSSIHAVGRRREAVARVRLYPKVVSGLMWGEREVKKGDVFVNEKPITEYFPSEVEKRYYTQPFSVTNTLGLYTVTIKVEGGGKNGQLGAVVHGIARALEKLNPESYRLLLRKKGLLTRDARTRERRKVGMGGKSRRKKQSPKR